MAAATEVLEEAAKAIGDNLDDASSLSLKDLTDIVSKLSDNATEYLSKDTNLFKDVVSDYASHAKDAFSAADLTKTLESSAKGSIDDQVKGLTSILGDKTLSAAEKLEQGKAFTQFRDSIIKSGENGTKIINDYDLLSSSVNDVKEAQKIVKNELPELADETISDTVNEVTSTVEDTSTTSMSGKAAKQAKKAVKQAKKVAKQAVDSGKKTRDSIEDIMTKKQKYIMEKEGYKYDLDNLRKSYPDASKLREHVSGLTGNSIDDLQSEGSMREALSASLHQRASQANLLDNLGYYKVPQVLAGVGTTAWLVSRLNSSKGQMSNAQLYGQQQQQ
jgi:hypothetical protein